MGIKLESDPTVKGALTEPGNNSFAASAEHVIGKLSVLWDQQSHTDRSAAKPSGTSNSVDQLSLDAARELMPFPVIEPDSYKEIFKIRNVGEIPKLPESLTAELLNSPCPFSSNGERIMDTHSLVFIPESLDGKPFTTSLLRALSNGADEDLRLRKTFVENVGFPQPFDETTLGKGSWALIYHAALPGSTERTPEDQLKELEKHPQYKTAAIQEITALFAMTKFTSGIDLLSNSALRCTDGAGSTRDLVGVARFGSGGLAYLHSDNESPLVGLAVARRL